MSPYDAEDGRRHGRCVKSDQYVVNCFMARSNPLIESENAVLQSTFTLTQ